MAHDLSLNLIVPTAAISMPEDGDDLDAAVMEAVIQNLGDRSAATIAAIYSHIAWAETLAVAPGGSLTSFSIEVGAIHRLFGLTATGTIRVGAAGTTTIGVSKVEGTPGTLGASARWWYVYAWMNGGTLDYAISLTGPDATGRVKSADASRVYLGCFPTDSAGNPIPVRAARGRYVYRRSACASNETRVLNTSAAAGATNLSLAALVPPHARLATLSLIVTGGDGFCGLTIYTDGDTSDFALQARAEAGITTSPVVGDVEASSAQVVDRVVTFGGTTGTAVAHVHGFLE